MPISCALYDQLEIFAMHKDKLRLKFDLADGKQEQIVAQIVDLYVREGKEYLLTEVGQEYSLEALVSAEKFEG